MTACSQVKSIANYSPAGEVDLPYWEEAFPQQYAEWADSVHGEIYLSGDDNAPTCNDCHEGPFEGDEIRTAELHLATPARCARCHSDDTLMEQYDIATDVYETYLADFHGVTINYYAQSNPTAIRDEAVCSDCHGSHAIYPKEVARSSISVANLQATCAKCHSGVPKAFTSAYGHYRPVISPASAKADSIVVFIVKLAYQMLIPIVLGGMLAYNALDIYHRVKRKKVAKEIVSEKADRSADPHETVSEESEVRP